MTLIKIHDDGLNSYGFRVLTEGIQLSTHKGNPVVFYNHDRKKGVIGRGTVQVTDEGLAVNPKNLEFHEVNDYAKEKKQLFEKGFLRAFSIGIKPLKWSSDPKYLMEGQTKATITECELLEFSLVDIPANRRAVRLYNEDGEEDETLLLSLELNGDESKIPDIPHQPISEMKELLKTLGLSDTATENEAIAKVKALQAKADNVSATQEAVANLAETAGIVSAEEKESFAALFAADPTNTVKMFGKKDQTAGGADRSNAQGQPRKGVADFVKENQGKRETTLSDDREKWTWKDWEEKDPEGLARLDDSDNETFNALYKDEFGEEPLTA